MKLRYVQPLRMFSAIRILVAILLISVALILVLLSGEGESAEKPMWSKILAVLVGGVIGFLVMRLHEKRLTRQRFNAWHREWAEATKFSSSSNEIVKHPAYRAIIKMGERALPFIFEALNNEREHWFVALAEITGVNPAINAPAGDLSAMREAWLEWGRNNGYLK